jgi:hypothetical protein
MMAVWSKRLFLWQTHRSAPTNLLFSFVNPLHLAPMGAAPQKELQKIKEN